MIRHYCDICGKEMNSHETQRAIQVYDSDPDSDDLFYYEKSTKDPHTTCGYDEVCDRCTRKIITYINSLKPQNR